MMKKSQIEYLFREEPPRPMGERPHISLLLGAGFSVPKGYPTAGEMRERLFDLAERSVVSHDGIVCACPDDVTRRVAELSDYTKALRFCLELMRIEEERSGEKLNYEVFYDFIRSDEIYEEPYLTIGRRYMQDYPKLVQDLPLVFMQLVAEALWDRNGNRFYDGINFADDDNSMYDRFVKFIGGLKETHVVDIHTLNHDLLMEWLGHSQEIMHIADGFDEYGSEYFGRVKSGSADYHIRLKRYTGIYDKPVRLYKLHGSLDYYVFYDNRGNILQPSTYVKLPKVVRREEIYRNKRSERAYLSYPFAFHPVCLTGVNSKVRAYDDRYLFKKLFKRFKANLGRSECLVIIGYGGWDDGINQLITEHFDWRRHKVVIINRSRSERLRELAERWNADFIEGDFAQVDFDGLR